MSTLTCAGSILQRAANIRREITGSLTAPTGTNVTREGVRNYTFTITRTQFTGDVTLSATGLPTGVMASFPDAGGNVLSGATLSCTVRLTAATDAPLVSSDAWSIEASGTGIMTVTASSVVSVLAIGAAEPFFEETFADGQLNPANGFTYASHLGSFQTQLDTQPLSSEIMAVADSGSNVESGFTHSLRSTFQGKSNPGQNGSPQIQFSFGRELHEFWMEWRLYVPSNYTHRDNSGTTDNNKFWNMFGADNSFGNPLCDLELTRDSGGKSYARCVVRRWDHVGASTEAVQNDRPEMIGAGFPLVPGTWNTIRMHNKLATEWGVSSDGRYRLWVNGTIVYDYDNLPFGARFDVGTDEGFKAGYLHGYQNSGYDADTTFFTQRIAVWDSNPGWV